MNLMTQVINEIRFSRHGLVEVLCATTLIAVGFSGIIAVVIVLCD